MTRRAVLLLVFAVIAVVLMILAAAYLFGVVSEQSLTEREKNTAQALNLAEAGLNQGIEQLRTMATIDLNNDTRLQNARAQDLRQYLGAESAKDSLDFLCDYLNFTRPDGVNDEVRFVVTPIALNTNISGANYNAAIAVRKQKDAAGNDMEAFSSANDVYTFPYEFRIEAQGQVNYTGKTGIITKNLFFSAGKFTITVQRGNFARYALFTNHHTAPNDTLVWFTEKTKFYGPVHTNDRFSFANNPGAYFSDAVTQHHNKAYFYNQGWPAQLDQNSNPPYDVPTFEQGFQRGLNEINLESSITSNDLRTKVGYQSSGPNGVYVANNGTNVTGGIYIKGNQGSSSDNAVIQLQADVDKAIYIINQDACQTTITVDYAANGAAGSTTINSCSSGNATYAGLPDGIDHQGTLIYSDDDIAGLYGVVTAASQLTVSSERDIVIANHIRYEKYNPAVDPEPINAEGYTNLLGILSWGGDIRIGISAPNNLDIHAVVMSVHGVFTVDDYDSGLARGNVNLLGGAITDFYGPFGTFSGTTQISGYGRNFIYDTRMKEIAPPYYPTLSYFVVSVPELEKDVKTMGLNWQEQ
jgi:hypothetical protein